MTHLPKTVAAPEQSCIVFDKEDIFVTIGVNSGEAIGLLDQVHAGDIYELDSPNGPRKLSLARDPSNQEAGLTVAAGSHIGEKGQPVRSLARHVLMSSDGNRVELIMIEVGDRLYAMPLSPMSQTTDYTLLHSETLAQETHLANLMCLSFARGTMIALASGRQMPIEDLKAGDMILTRDHGPQPLRLLCHATTRALGGFAPVVITAGTMGNLGDLVVSQQHRIFLYQRNRPLERTTSELLVQARHLVDDETTFIREGGFVDWYGLIFDRHEIIYAEGIPVESLLVNEATVSRLMPEVAAQLRQSFPNLAQVQHFGTEANRQMLEELRRTEKSAALNLRPRKPQ